MPTGVEDSGWISSHGQHLPVIRSTQNEDEQWFCCNSHATRRAGIAVSEELNYLMGVKPVFFGTELLTFV